MRYNDLPTPECTKLMINTSRQIWDHPMYCEESRLRVIRSGLTSYYEGLIEKEVSNYVIPVKYPTEILDEILKFEDYLDRHEYTKLIRVSIGIHVITVRLPGNYVVPEELGKINLGDYKDSWLVSRLKGYLMEIDRINHIRNVETKSNWKTWDELGDNWVAQACQLEGSEGIGRYTTLYPDDPRWMSGLLQFPDE